MPRPIQENVIYQQFDIAEDMLRARFRYHSPPGFLMTGLPGLGKTYSVRKIYKEITGLDVEPITGTALGVMDYIYEHRNDVLVFDDFDRMFYTPAIMELFLKLLDSNEPRILSDLKRSENALPPFRVRAVVVVLTNRKFENPAHFGKAFHAKYIAPFLSRLLMSKIALSEDSNEILEYTLHHAPKILADVRLPELRHVLTEGQKFELLDHFVNNYHTYPSIAPRVIHLLGQNRLSFRDLGDYRWDRARRAMLNDMEREMTQREKDLEELSKQAEREVERENSSLVQFPRNPFVKE
jgi:hypothetical protein